MTKNELIEKIKKLLALSDSSNPNEASVALSRAQKLIEKYNIEFSELQTANGIGEIKLKPLSSLNTQTTMNIMLSIIKKAFGIEPILLTTNSKVTTVVLVGPDELMESCDYIFTVLSRYADKAIKDYEKIVEAEVLIESFHNEALIASIKKYVPTFFRMVYEPLKAAIKEQSENKIVINDEIYNDNQKRISKLFKEYRNEAYNFISYGRVCELKKIYSSMIKEKKNGFIRGYFSSIERKIAFCPMTESQEKNITAYIQNSYPNLTQGRCRSLGRNKAAFDAYQRGLSEGSKISLNSAIKDRSPKIDVIGMT